MNLLALQRDFRTWLTSESEEAATRLGSPAGLAVYRNNYRGQLLACLTENYPTLRAWLGETAFAAAAERHIDRAPPDSWTLDAYVAGFPETLALLYPRDAEVVELAQIEQCVGECFVGPDAAVLDPATLGGIDWEQALLCPTPTLRTLSVTTNVTTLWAAIDAGTAPPPAQALTQPATLLLWRKDFTVLLRQLDSGEAEALQGARAGIPFGVLCARLVECHGEEQGTALAGTWLGQWLRDGLVVAVA